MDPSLREQVLRVIAADPRAQLRRGSAACVGRGGSILDMGHYRHVVVLDADAAAAAAQGGAVLVLERCRRMRLARGVVLLPGLGAGVLLLAAARAGATQTARALVGFGVHVAVVDDDYNTPLHLACTENRVACACALLEVGAVEHSCVRNVRYMTPGGVAATHGLTAVVRRIHTSPGGRDLARGVLQQFPLVHAAYRGDTGAVAALLRQGAAVDACTPERSTALSVAVEEGHLAVMGVLIAARADVDHTSGETPDTESGCRHLPLVLLAVQHGQPEALALLLAAAADPDLGASSGSTALHKASGEGHLHIVQMLLEAGAKVDVRTNQEQRMYKHPPGSTALGFAVGSGHAQVAKLLLARAADPNSRALSPAGRRCGAAPLHYTTLAITAGQAVYHLADARAEVDARFGIFTAAGGVTPLIGAAVANNQEVVEALLAVGANPDLRCRGLIFRAAGFHGTARDIAIMYRREAARSALEVGSGGAGSGGSSQGEFN